jgi:hypothetical protein
MKGRTYLYTLLISNITPTVLKIFSDGRAGQI